MISGLILIALGTLGIVIALIEFASFFVESANVFWSLVRRLTGRTVHQTSQMQVAMFWIQAFGLLLGGCVFVYAGLSVWES